jgi:hypothetical protein
MPAEPSTAEELTRRLLARMSGTGDDSVRATLAARDACDCVSTEFSRWLGVRGYEALVSRMLTQLRPAHPALQQVHYDVAADQRLTGVAESMERHGGEATARALVALLESIFAVCTRLIGDDLVATLVEKSMENRTHDELGRDDTLDQRSARL